MEGVDFYNNSKLWYFYKENILGEALKQIQKEQPSDFLSLIEEYLNLESEINQLQSYGECTTKLYSLKEKLDEKNDPILFSHLLLSEGEILRKRGKLIESRDIITDAITNFEKIKEQYQFGIIFACRKMIHVLYLLGDYKAAKKFCEMGMSFITDKKLYVDSYIAFLNNMGIIMQAQGESSRAVVFLDEAFKLAKLEKKYDIFASLANNLGDFYLNQGNYKKAQEYLIIGMETAKELNYTDMLCYLYINLGLLESNKGNWANAENYYNVGMKIAQKSVKALHSTYLSEIALHYRRKGNYSESISKFKEAIALYRLNQIENNEFIKTLGSLAELLGIIDDFEAAYAYLKEARNLARQKKMQLGNLQISLILAKLSLLKSDYIFADYVLSDISFYLSDEIEKNFIIEFKLTLVECFIQNYKVTKNKDIIDKASKILEEIVEISEENQLLPYLIHAKFLQAVLISIRPENRDEAIKNLNFTIKLAKEKEIESLKRIGNVILEDLERKKYSSEELADLFIQYFNTLNYTIKISDDEREMIEKIGILLISISDLGPDIIAGIDRPEELDEIQGMRMATFISVSIGQGGEYHQGLFGPLPISAPNQSLALISSHIIKDKTNKDKRLADSNLALMTILVPEKIIRFFNDRSIIQTIISNNLEEITSLAEITEEILYNVKTEIIENILPTIPSKK
ncbi:hypothetical protein NEF87_002410 [Candidatus Lokiarchaeum ossiferum]|uniref:Tetratricopeptide repeat protein n=1 Tax=Candidatus Lokiarchaeum ossiferum TaxID=2951803 RepID=A0ABY6HRI9_9ARCH|nr:hypothetical protein NEF87_002410 [Candidatus Lokiarchaeum sp. B-35]